MGKGDKKSRKGKIFSGSYGNTRPKKKTGKRIMSNNHTIPENKKVIKETDTKKKITTKKITTKKKNSKKK